MIRNNPYSKTNTCLVGLVTTPIGNREDITLRALSFLKEADIIACEDTRNTALLLKGYDIKPKKLVSLYAQTEAKEAKKLVQEVKANKLKMAYCSDAGMPGISDPGALLVQACYEENVPVTILPGPTASLSALVLSGIDSADFSFFGFLPTKSGQMKSMLEGLAERKESLIFYESPKRIKKTVSLMGEIFGMDREVSLVRELTKIHEETLHGTFQEILSSEIDERGEYVIIVKGYVGEKKTDWQEIEKKFKAGIKKGKTLSDLSKEIASEYKISKKEVYAFGLSLKQK